MTALNLGVFAAIVVFCLWLDLHLHKADQPISMKNAALWSAVWVAVSFAFAGYLAATSGPDKAWLFVTGYLLEKSLSVDNLFVFMAIFASFSIKDAFQHRILYYGILGALVLRLVFVYFGTTLLSVGTLSPLLHMAVYGVFGAVVLYSAYAMWRGANESEEDDIDYSKHWAVRWAGKLFPVLPSLRGHSFFVRNAEPRVRADAAEGAWLATPLFLCLCVVETSDVAFAFDSVPAVIAVTKEPFLVYTSNIFAILGLRSMYFLLAAAKRYLCHLEKAIIAILVFIGGKLLLEGFQEPVAALLGTPLHITPSVSLAVVVTGLALGVLASVMFPEKEPG